MAIYEYRCEHCGVFEEMQRITDPPLARCPKCRKKVQRLISSTSFQLKGTGWYVTDYARSGGGEKKDAKDTDGGSKSEAKSDTKSDAKADAKSEGKSETKSATTTSATS